MSKSFLRSEDSSEQKQIWSGHSSQNVRSSREDRPKLINNTNRGIITMTKCPEGKVDGVILAHHRRAHCRQGGR